MQKVTVKEAQQQCLERNLPFYSYRLPGEHRLFLGLQTQGPVKEFERFKEVGEGFIAVPFAASENEPSLFIRGDFSFVDEVEAERFARVLEGTECYSAGNGRLPEKSVSREKYDRQVRQMISVLQDRVVRKLVLARGITLDCGGYACAAEWFEKLTLRYPDAFVFLVSVPGVMTWLGATPEIFLQQTEGLARTMSLAGTRRAGSGGDWGGKEVEEQAIVSEYIAGILRNCGVWESEGPMVKRAGNVEHICTVFTFRGKLPPGQADAIRRQLHPTPAVGGFPATEAIDLVNEIEGGNRRYYAGYLGPVHGDGTFHWYVNLRSMELFAHSIRLYVGGGITVLSDPDAEWEETELKSRTLLDVIL